MRRYIPPQGAPAYPRKPSLRGYRISFARTGTLRPHEKILPKKVKKMAAKIRGRDYFHKPILADSRSKTILDGHHKWNAARKLGLARVPVLFVNYLADKRIRVKKWETARVARVSKRDVVARGRSGRLYTPKTSRHILPAKLPKIRIPLEELA